MSDKPDKPPKPLSMRGLLTKDEANRLTVLEIRDKLETDELLLRHELADWFRKVGWLKHLPALIDENGVVISGHRRLRLSALLLDQGWTASDVTPKVLTINFGQGGEADAERIKYALASNLGAKGLSKADRERMASYLYRERAWSLECIAQALDVSRQTISNDLRAAKVVTNQYANDLHIKPEQSPEAEPANVHHLPAPRPPGTPPTSPPHSEAPAPPKKPGRPLGSPNKQPKPDPMLVRLRALLHDQSWAGTVADLVAQTGMAETVIRAEMKKLGIAEDDLLPENAPEATESEAETPPKVQASTKPAETLPDVDKMIKRLWRQMSQNRDDNYTLSQIWDQLTPEQQREIGTLSGTQKSTWLEFPSRRSFSQSTEAVLAAYRVYLKEASYLADNWDKVPPDLQDTMRYISLLDLQFWTHFRAKLGLDTAPEAEPANSGKVERRAITKPSAELKPIRGAPDTAPVPPMPKTET